MVLSGFAVSLSAGVAGFGDPGRDEGEKSRQKMDPGRCVERGCARG